MEFVEACDPRHVPQFPYELVLLPDKAFENPSYCEAKYLT